MSYAVVIPLYNGGSWIEQTLESVFAQTLPPTEVVVVDDGSTDDSAQRARTFPEVLLLHNPAKGTLPARNLGFRHTTAPLIAFVDHDDVWHPEHAARLSDLLRHNPDVPAAASAVERFADGAQPTLDATSRGVVEIDPWAAFPLRTPILTPSAAMVQRRAFEQVGGWNEELRGVADFHIWLRLSVAAPLLGTGAATTGKRMHRTSYLHTLIASDPVGRLERRAAAAEDAAGHRLEHVSSARDRDTVICRARLSRHVATLARAALTADHDGIRLAAMEIERMLQEESESRRIQLFRFLHYSLCNESDPTRHFVHIFRMLLDLWPRQAISTRSALHAFLGMVASRARGQRLDR